MDIIRGSLDGITRSASSHQRQRPDSSISLHSGTASPALRLDVSNSFEILPPEQDLQYEEHDLAIEEYMSDGTDEDTDGYSSVHDDAVQQLERLIFSRGRSSQSNSASERISSTNSKDEIPSGTPPQKEKDTKESEDLNDIQDPELRKALKKMRKLDKILMQKISREKEVKRQRRVMHRQYQEELERIKHGMDRKEPKEELENTEKFLALVPPPNHSEGIDDEDDGEMYSASPLFRTEPPEGASAPKDQPRSGYQSPGSDASWDTKDSVKGSKQGRGERRRRSKADAKSAANDDDFIQRNIQLASDAGNTIAMTDDEKKRLGELLQDVEMLGEEQEEKEVTGYELQMLPGTGYQPDKTEEAALKSLDEKLKALMLPKNFEEICSTPLMEKQPTLSNPTYQQEAFELGEKILQDHKVTRDYKDRLKQIEEELVALQTQVEKEISSPSLSQDELNDLFRQCDDVDNRTQSALSSPRTPRPTSSTHFGGESRSTQPNSSRESAAPSGANTSRTEKLSEDTLKQLLDEAKAGLGLEEPDVREDDLILGEVEWGDGEAILQTGDVIEVRSQQNSRISHRTSAQVPLISYDVIQKLLMNPRATLDEAQRPINLTNEDSMDEEERNQYNR